MDPKPKKKYKYPKYTSCAVAICKNRNAEDGLTFHRFPKDPVRQKAWVTKCKRQDKFNATYAKICSRHFLPEHFREDKVNAALGLPTRKYLTEDAIPSLYLSEKETYTKAKLARRERQAKRAAEKEYQKVKLNLETLINETIISNNDYEVKETVIDSTDDVLDVSNVFIVDQTAEEEQPMSNEHAKDILAAEKLKIECRILQQKLHQKTLECRMLAMEKINIHKQTKARALTSHSQRASLKVFQKYFPSLSGGRHKASWRRKTWTNLDIINAVALRTTSRQSYELVLKKKMTPVPRLRTLSRWTKAFSCSPGIIKEMLLLLRAKAETMPADEPLSRLCVVSFAEMSTSDFISYCRSQDRVYGPAKSVLVVVLRGLCSDFKQVIFYDFNVSMTSEKLAEIIVQVDKIGFNVVAVSSDIGEQSQQLWKTLMFGTMKPYMLHPADETRKIWIFYDVLHLVKLLRKHFLDDGITSSVGDVFNNEIIEMLLERDIGQEVKLVKHMSASDLTIKGPKSQQVSQAARLFSAQTTDAICYFTKNNAAFLFFKLVSDVLDVLNSRQETCSSCPLRSAFRMGDVRQVQTLRKFEEECLRMRCGPRKVMMPFQMGFIISVRALLGMSAEMAAFGVERILTARLSHDCLDNFFSRVISLGGGNEDPNAYEFQTRLRRLLMTQSAEGVTVSDASLFDGDDLANFVSNELLVDIVDTRSLVLKSGDVNSDFEVDFSGITSKDKFSQESDALLFVAGYVAHKCQDIDPTLGSRKDKIPLKFVNKWLSICGFGGLLMPSKAFLELCEQFELWFTSFHENMDKAILNEESGVQKRLAKMLSQQYPEVDKRVVDCYVNARTYLRINFHNQHSHSKSGNAFPGRKRKYRKHLI